MIRVKNWAVVLSISLSGVVFSQSGSIPTHYTSLSENTSGNSNSSKDNFTLSAKDYLDISINRLMDDPVLRSADWGFVLYDPKTKKIVSSYNQEKPLIPASTTKLLTTDTALSLLGPEFRWITQLEYSGAIDENGVLQGNLHIVGSGDPSLGTGKAGALRYASLANELVSAIALRGIKKVTGDIVIQNAIFKENRRELLPENIVWMEHSNYYLPVGSTKGIDPRKEKLSISKKNPFEETKQYFYISPYVNKLVFADEFAGRALDTQLPTAPFYLANTLKSYLAKGGIGVAGKVEARTIDRAPEQREILYTYRSPKLKEIVYDTNQRSDNALSESLLRMVGFQKLGDQSLETGRRVVVNHLDQKGFDTSELIYIDGSGLSRSHRVTPISQALFLAKGMEESYYDVFFDSLPIAGQTGTLKRTFEGTGYGKIFAKTGTLNKVKTLAGYVRTDSGRLLTFSLLINNYAGSVTQVKTKMEELLGPISQF